MKKITSVITLMAAMFLALPAVADTVTTVGAAQWNTWSSATGVRTAGFWDGASDDGTTCNLGFWLTGTNGSCAFVSGSGFVGPRPGALPFLSAAGSPQTPIPFTVNPVGGTRTVTLRLEVAGFRDINVFGYYLLSNPGVLVPLFAGSDLPGTTASFTPAGPFAFYLQNPGGVFRSQTNLNFALFSQDPASPTLASNLLHYWVGVEDKPVPAGPYTTPFLPNVDADYNDALISMQVAPPDTGRGCTLTQGGYKNHFNSKLLNSPGFVLGTKFYSATQLNQILQNNSVRGNGLISLSHQLITAKLNIFYGASAPQSVVTAIVAADALIGALVVPPIGSGYLAPASTSALTKTLDNFNNGLIGPGHCK